MTDICLRRAALLGRIWAYKQEHGYPPAMRNLVGEDTYSSMDSIHHNLRVLEREGYLRWDPNKARTIRLTVKGEALCQ